MTKNEETRFFLPCGCADNCTILAVDRWQWDEGEPTKWYFELYTRVGERASLWYRTKLAWKILWGKNHYLDAFFWTDEEIQKLRDFITP